MRYVGEQDPPSQPRERISFCDVLIHGFQIQVITGVAVFATFMALLTRVSLAFIASFWDLFNVIE